MRATESQTKRLLARFAVLALLAGLSVLGFGQPAAAHGQLAYAEPAKDSSVSQPLDRVSLYFTEKPPGDAYFTLSAPDGSRVDNGWSGGEPKRLDEPVQELNLVDGKWQPAIYSTGFPAVIGVAHWPATGRYVARYLSLASDGDKVQGEVAFDYTGPVTSPPAGGTVPADQPAARLTGASADPGSTPDTQPVDSQPTGQAAAAATGDSGWGIWLLPAVIVLVAAFLIANAVRKSRSDINARIRADVRRKPGVTPSGGKRPGGKAARKASGSKR